MSITAETAKAHANDPAVLCCRAEAGIVIGAENLEDPAIFDDLVDSGLLNLDGCLTIEEVLGAKLIKTCDSLSPLTADVLEGVKAKAVAEEAVEEYKRNLLGIEDMREIYNQRREDWGCHTDYQINLQLNKQTGLYYIQHNFLLCNDLLINHLLVEQLWSNKDQVDWKRVTNCFDYEVVNKMSCILTHPLVWIPTEDVGEYCVVVGKVAGEVNPPRNYYF